MSSVLNKTIKLYEEDIEKYSKQIIIFDSIINPNTINKTINGNTIDVLPLIDSNKFDLVIADPPYNLTKNYDGYRFSKKDNNTYIKWFEKWIVEVKRVLKENGTFYVCADWHTSNIIYPLLEANFIIQNRITFKRDKGRGCNNNWKNNMEDVWFCTNSNHYTFNVDKVKTQKVVKAPYVDKLNKPKDWSTKDNVNIRYTYPSNCWDDITIPFWSMSENTEHSTQKPEKLIAKLILASSNEGDLILDPFLGSGTTSVVAKKLNRNYIGIELSKRYCLITEKRLALADINKDIQGYKDGYFLEK